MPHDPQPPAVLPRRMDLGMRVAALSRTITPAQVAEMLAIRLAMFHPERVPILASYSKDETHAPLIRAGILTSRQPDGWNRGWRMMTLTELGERVLLHVAEEAMLATRRMAPDPEIEDDE